MRLFFIMFLAVAFLQTARAELLAVTLSPAPAGPSPKSVVDWFRTSPSSPSPVPVFDLSMPLDIQYGMTPRLEPSVLARLEQEPVPARARIERTLIVRTLNASTRASLLSSKKIESVSVVQESGTVAPSTPNSEDLVTSTQNQYHLSLLNVPAARSLSPGWALIGVADSGVATAHPDLQYSVGGNYLPVYSIDTSPKDYAVCDYEPASPRPYRCHNFRRDTEIVDLNVDEAEPVPAIIFGGGIYCSDPSATDCSLCEPSGCTPLPPPCGSPMIPVNIGHGTHVAGLIAANSSSTSGTTAVDGVCRSCGLAVAKFASHICAGGSGARKVVIEPIATELAQAVTWLQQVGSQVINLSLGGAQCVPGDSTFCNNLDEAVSSDIAMVAASGNNRTDIQAPGRYSERVISVGGYDSSLRFWDDLVNTGSCRNPFDLPPSDPGYQLECGSNYDMITTDGAVQETIAASKDVLSLFYPLQTWNPKLFCGDPYYSTGNDGVGLCTGTSMAAPQISAVIGMIRSANPLIRVGTPSVPSSVRGVLASTANKSDTGVYTPYSAKFGYGRPDTELAVRRVLGGTATNNSVRITPVFALASSSDLAYTTSPQTASSLLRFSSYSHWSRPTTSNAVKAYCLPRDYNAAANTCINAPRANFYVYVSDRKVTVSHPALVPIYALDRNHTAGTGRDFMLSTSLAEVNTLTASYGYSTRGVIGYVASASNANWGGEALYRRCKPLSGSDRDCAVFTQSDETFFTSLGYNNVFPAGSSDLLGYAFHNRDADADGLIDGFEYLIGSAFNAADTDGDGCADGREFPLAGIAVRNPTAVDSGACPNAPFTPDVTPGSVDPVVLQTYDPNGNGAQCKGLRWQVPSGTVSRYEVNVIETGQVTTWSDIFMNNAQLIETMTGGWLRVNYRVRACSDANCGPWSAAVYYDDFCRVMNG